MNRVGGREVKREYVGSTSRTWYTSERGDFKKAWYSIIVLMSVCAVVTISFNF